MDGNASHGQYHEELQMNAQLLSAAGKGLKSAAFAAISRYSMGYYLTHVCARLDRFTVRTVC